MKDEELEEEWVWTVNLTSIPEFELHCPTCGYSLTGLPENRCPECGTEYDPDQLREAMIRRRRRTFYVWAIVEPILFVFVLGRLLSGEVEIAGQTFFVVAMVINAFLIAVKLDTLRAPYRPAGRFILVIYAALIVLLQYAMFIGIELVSEAFLTVFRLCISV